MSQNVPKCPRYRQMLDISICWTLIFRPPRWSPFKLICGWFNHSTIHSCSNSCCGSTNLQTMATSGGFPWVFSRFPIQNSHRAPRFGDESLRYDGPLAALHWALGRGPGSEGHLGYGLLQWLGLRRCSMDFRWLFSDFFQGLSHETMKFGKRDGVSMGGTCCKHFMRHRHA
jgi:hypothetical protein